MTCYRACALDTGRNRHSSHLTMSAEGVWHARWQIGARWGLCQCRPTASRWKRSRLQRQQQSRQSRSRQRCLIANFQCQPLSPRLGLEGHLLLRWACLCWKVMRRKRRRSSLDSDCPMPHEREWASGRTGKHKEWKKSNRSFVCLTLAPQCSCRTPRDLSSKCHI